MSRRICAEEVVLMLKARKLSTPAYAIAENMGTTSRAVATALRGPVKDGRVSCWFKKGMAFYRFVRLSPRAKGAPNE